ncbi:hypothetical protein B0H11DRAFT_1930564 [Mycena galericulata]|nr:hypothetical protein B0H11DRAFT_1930564 [Mycena galericulata]
MCASEVLGYAYNECRVERDSPNAEMALRCRSAAARDATTAARGGDGNFSTLEVEPPPWYVHSTNSEREYDGILPEEMGFSVTHENSTGLGLEAYLATAAVDRATIRKQREGIRAEKEIEGDSSVGLGTLEQEWPEVAAAEATASTSKVDQEPAVPGEWLRDRRLWGRRLDVIITGGKDEGKVGEIRELQITGTGKRAKVEVYLAPWPVEGVRKCDPSIVEPLRTTRDDRTVTKENERSIFTEPGMSVVIIGMCNEGSDAWVGKEGFVENGGIRMGSDLRGFPQTSVCRSRGNKPRDEHMQTKE